MNDLMIIQNKIYEIRGQKVMLDRDLAELYGVETKVLNQAVKRNIERFPDDFMFQLTREEWQTLSTQLAFKLTSDLPYDNNWGATKKARQEILSG